MYYELEIPLATAMMPPAKTTRRRVTPRARAEKRRERMRKEKGKQVKDGNSHKLPNSWESNVKVRNEERVTEATTQRGVNLKPKVTDFNLKIFPFSPFALLAQNHTVDFICALLQHSISILLVVLCTT